MLNKSNMNIAESLERAVLPSMLVSYRCCNKLPQFYWLKITQANCLTFLEIRSPKWVLWGENQGVSRAEFLLDIQGRIHSLPFVTSRGCSPSLTCGHITPTSASVITSPFLTLTLPTSSYEDPCGYIEPI